MDLLLAFSLTLLLAVFLSDLARRTLLSTAALFLVTGIALRELGVVATTVDLHGLAAAAELTLFSVLYVDGMRVSWSDLKRWRLPVRALLVAMPLTFLVLGAAAKACFGLSWPEALLVAAVLSPTDPVFASAVIGREELPFRVRHLLGVESGLNDGLALPVVVGFISYLGAGGESIPTLLEEVLLGLGIGVVVPVGVIAAARLPVVRIDPAYEPLLVVALALLVLATASLLHGNVYLAAYAAGLVVGNLRQDAAARLQKFGHPFTEFLKLGALMLFAFVIWPRQLAALGWPGLWFVLAALLLARPLPMALALAGTRLGRDERRIVGWFGPRGFASILYGALVLQSGIPNAAKLAHVVALTVVASVLAHSSTDVPAARWFQRRHPARA